MSTKQKDPTPPRSPRVVVDVLQEDIDTAMPKDSRHCMIADAIKRAVPSARHVQVDLQTIRWTDPKKGLRYVYLTPREPIIALLRFDYGIKPTPLSFRLRGAQVASATRVTKDGKQKLAHKLGKKRFRDSRAVRRGGRPEIIGGKTPPIHKWSQRREFGVRALTLVDVFGEAARQKGIAEVALKKGDLAADQK